MAPLEADRRGHAGAGSGLYPGAGTVDGVSGRPPAAPPLIIDRGQVDEMVRMLDESLTAVAMDLTAVQD